MTLKVPLTDAQTDVIAATAHELNRAYRLSIGERVEPHWEDVTPEMRRSTLLGVQGALSGNTPEQQHEQWRATRIADGWVHGPIKDAEFRTHPCLVPYSDLPREQQVKDTLFRNVVLAVAQAFEWWS